MGMSVVMTERYRLSFTTGGLFLLEAPMVTDHYLATSRDWEHTRADERCRNLLQVRTASAATRISKELIARLEMLDLEELELLVEAKDGVQKSFGGIRRRRSTS